MPALLFFQAAATIIPTLAVAFAVSGKFLSPSTLTIANPGDRHLVMGVLVTAGLLFVVFAIRAERTCLHVLATGDATKDRYDSVMIALGIMAVCLGVAVLSPLVNQARQWLRPTLTQEDMKAQKEWMKTKKEDARSLKTLGFQALLVVAVVVGVSYSSFFQKV